MLIQATTKLGLQSEWILSVCGSPVSYVRGCKLHSDASSEMLLGQKDQTLICRWWVPLVGKALTVNCHFVDSLLATFRREHRKSRIRTIGRWIKERWTLLTHAALWTKSDGPNWSHIPWREVWIPELFLRIVHNGYHTPTHTFSNTHLQA